MEVKTLEIKSAKKQNLSKFRELMQDVAKLPEEQREIVAYFAQGVIAMSANQKVVVINE